jgi:hypothetical protein
VYAPRFRLHSISTLRLASARAASTHFETQRGTATVIRSTVDLDIDKHWILQKQGRAQDRTNKVRPSLTLRRTAGSPS